MGALMKCYIMEKHDDDDLHTGWANPVADSGGYDYKEHGLSSTKLRSFLWACCGLYGVCCGKITWCFDYRIAGERDCKMVLHGCWHDWISNTMMLIFWALWLTWPRKLAEMCVNIWYTPWSKGMTTRVAIHREHTCQLVLTRLRDSRDRKHKIETILLYLESYGHGISQRRVQQY